MDTQTETTTEDTGADVQPEEALTEVTAEPTREQPVERPQQSRKDRKRERVDVEAAQRERDEIRRTLEAERNERARIDRELAEMRGRLEERARTGQQQDKHAEAKSKIESLRDQAWSQLALSAQAKDPAEAARFRKEYQRLMDEADDVRDEIRANQRWEKQRGEISQAMPDPQAQAELTYLNTRFPWLADNEDAQALADSRLKILLQKGAPGNRETAVAAITWAAQQLKIGGQTAPTNGQRQLYAGVPAGEGAGGDERPRSVKMGRHEEAMARAAYPHLPAKDAYKQWARDMVESDNDE